jgi:DNA-binding NarL/FixJ family response regulator
MPSEPDHPTSSVIGTAHPQIAAHPGIAARPAMSACPVATVVLATPVRLYREGLALALGPDPRMAVVGSAGTGEEVIAAVATFRPDVLVADSSLVLAPGLLDRVRGLHAGLRVVAIGLGDDLDDVVECAAAGAVGYVSRDARAAELAAVVQGVLTGELTCSTSVAALLLHRLLDRAPAGQPRPGAALPGAAVPGAALPGSGLVEPAGAEPARTEVSRAGLRSVPGPPPATDPLSDREREVAALVAEGLMNKQIARRLGLSLSTVKNHVHSILGKQGLTSRLELGRVYRDAGASIVAPAAARR